MWTWSIIGLAGIAVLGARTTPRLPETAPATVAIASPAPSAQIGNGYAGATLARAADSHFYADAQVNGAQVRFLIDTGATGLVLTRNDAQRAGVAMGGFSANGVGVGGEVRLAPVSLGRVAIGPLSANNVAAMVAEDGLPVSLMGQSYLSRLGSVTIRGDEMVLR